MGSDDGMTPKEGPSSVRRWLYRCRLYFSLPQYRRYIISVTLLISGLIFFFYVNEPKHEIAVVSLKGDSQPSLPKQGALKKITNKRLFYNRVPKCGSSTLVELLKKLAVRNRFQHTSSPILDDWAIFQQPLLADFVNTFQQAPAKSSFDRHLFFVDFNKFGQENPIYINMIRDPTERFISEFYFRRRLQHEGMKKGEWKWYDEDLENCVRTGKDYDCRLIDGTFMKNMIAFFCGQDINCSKHNSPEALAKAKWNVERYFTVVGILEDLDMTLHVLEKKLPGYFAGAQDLHESTPDHVVNKGKNRLERVSEDVKKMIRANLTAEYDFYNFIRDRLIAQSTGEL